MAALTLWELITAAEAEHASDDEMTVAMLILKSLKVSQSAADVLAPLVAIEIGRSRRETMRELEERAWPSRSPRAESGEAPVDLVQARAQLIDSGFWRVDGRHVEWGKATIEDHEARIGWFRKHIAGCERTVARHALAIDLIRAAGVTCLAEIEDAA